MWAAIDLAKETVWVETYVLNHDAVGLTTINKLLQAQLRGCQVVVIYDSVGSMSLQSEYLIPLQRAGAQVIQFHPLIGRFRGFRSWQSPLFRTHRKLLIVDQKIGFCGGLNLADDYAGTSVGGNGRFRDTHSRVEGEAATDLARVFIESLYSNGTIEVLSAPGFH